MSTENLTARINVSHTNGDKNAPFCAEAILNTESVQQARELGALFPEFVTVSTSRNYRRLSFQSCFSVEGSRVALDKLDAFIQAAEAQGIAVEWVSYNPETYYDNRAQLAAHIG